MNYAGWPGIFKLGYKTHSKLCYTVNLFFVEKQNHCAPYDMAHSSVMKFWKPTIP